MKVKRLGVRNLEISLLINKASLNVACHINYCLSLYPFKLYCEIKKETKGVVKSVFVLICNDLKLNYAT